MFASNVSQHSNEATTNENIVNKFKQLVSNELNVELNVTVITANENKDGTFNSNITLNKLITSAIAMEEAIVFTFTPGPFKPTDSLPENWMEVTDAKGCTLQLNTFEKELADANLNATVYAINKQSSEYQCGPDGLLLAKKYFNLHMISDESGELQKELGLPIVPVSGKEYLKRFSVVIKPNGEVHLFTLSSPVNETKIREHLTAIKNCISPPQLVEVETERNAPTAAH